ncbi:uncharacterized protein LOC115301964 [Suricata suricatta]|uniref:uncharacterized protein LOC115301964 n=1 Tax=Suricata suricatta TaxID=37032 RepID=UPI0011559236|nr:uncharacterized protein LOC115301964 [Suricata suricatta]
MEDRWHGVWKPKSHGRTILTPPHKQSIQKESYYRKKCGQLVIESQRGQGVAWRSQVYQPMDYIAMEEAVFIGLTENRRMKDLRVVETFKSLQIHVFSLHSPLTLNRELFFLNFKLTADHRHQRRSAFKSENMSSVLPWPPVFGGGTELRHHSGGLSLNHSEDILRKYLGRGEHCNSAGCAAARRVLQWSPVLAFTQRLPPALPGQGGKNDGAEPLKRFGWSSTALQWSKRPHPSSPHCRFHGGAEVPAPVKQKPQSCGSSWVPCCSRGSRFRTSAWTTLVPVA